MNCEVCAKNFSGIVPYNQHIESEKHKRKVANAEQSKTVGVKSTSVFNPIHCPACNISFDSFMLFQSHSLTQEHVDNVTKKYPINEVDNPKFDGVTSTTSKDTIENGLSKSPIPFEDKEDSILPPMQSFEINHLASFTECETCNKKFSGPEPYKQHLVSALHKKKVEMESFLSSTTSQNAVNKFECEPCKKMFSGPVPLQQHMVSEIHRKKLQQVLLLEQYNKSKEESSSMMEVDSNNVKTKADSPKNMDINRPWFCNICLIQCSGLIPYKQHLEGDAHLKNSRKADLLKSSINMKSKSEDGTVAGDLPISNNDEHTFAAPMFHVGLKTLDMETDFILPGALKSLSMVSPADINVKEFYPDVKIDFDSYPNEQAKDENDSLKASVDAHLEYEQTGDTTDANMIVDVQCLKNQQLDQESEDLDDNQLSIYKSSVEFQMDDVYEECKLCNVKLRNKSEALSHFESLTHFMKKYRPE